MSTDVTPVLHRWYAGTTQVVRRHYTGGMQRVRQYCSHGSILSAGLKSAYCLQLAPADRRVKGAHYKSITAHSLVIISNQIKKN